MISKIAVLVTVIAVLVTVFLAPTAGRLMCFYAIFKDRNYLTIFTFIT